MCYKFVGVFRKMMNMHTEDSISEFVSADEVRESLTFSMIEEYEVCGCVVRG